MRAPGAAAGRASARACGSASAGSAPEGNPPRGMRHPPSRAPRRPRRLPAGTRLATAAYRLRASAARAAARASAWCHAPAGRGRRCHEACHEVCHEACHEAAELRARISEGAARGGGALWCEVRSAARRRRLARPPHPRRPIAPGSGASGRGRRGRRRRTRPRTCHHRRVGVGARLPSAPSPQLGARAGLLGVQPLLPLELLILGLFLDHTRPVGACALRLEPQCLLGERGGAAHCESLR